MVIREHIESPFVCRRMSKCYGYKDALFTPSRVHSTFITLKCYDDKYTKILFLNDLSKFKYEQYLIRTGRQKYINILEDEILHKKNLQSEEYRILIKESINLFKLDLIEHLNRKNDFVII